MFRICSKMLHVSRRGVHTKRRAVLYVPGDQERKLQKAKNIVGIDCVAFDCEDGVAVNRKQAARDTICEFFNKNKLPANTDWGVRINSLSSGLLRQDLEVVLSGDKHPNTIFLPKVNSVEDIRAFYCILEDINRKVPLDLIFYAESCSAIMDLAQICRVALEISESKGLAKPVGLVFGSDDFCASLGISRTEDSMEILYARQKVVLVAKAFDMQAIDMVCIDFKDESALRKQATQGAIMGYTGKQVIHPNQVPIVQESFMPSAERVEWAKELLEAYAYHQNSGMGAFVFRNQMIDSPTMKQAQNIIELTK